jgi:CheY-like chemotaxis protein
MPQNRASFTSLAPCRVLICEDLERNIALACSITQGFGCEITTASNGEEAVEHCQHQKFDVILMDLAMPVMSGLEASRLITSAVNPNQTTPIVAVTADHDPIVKAGCHSFGIAYFITKPVDEATLHRILSECKAMATAESKQPRQH